MKLNWFVKYLNRKFKELWNPGKYNTIDEAMIATKNPHSGIRNYNPAKPVKSIINVYFIFAYL